MEASLHEPTEVEDDEVNQGKKRVGVTPVASVVDVGSLGASVDKSDDSVLGNSFDSGIQSAFSSTQEPSMEMSETSNPTSVERPSVHNLCPGTSGNGSQKNPPANSKPNKVAKVTN